MKKFAIVLSFVICLTTSLNAQTLIGEINQARRLNGSIIPSIFTVDERPYLDYSSWNNNDNCYYVVIYNSDDFSNLINTTINDYIFPLTCHNSNSMSTYNILLTQTLFNTDPDFEYLASYGDSITINSLNSGVLSTLYPDEGYSFVLFENDILANLYLMEENYYLALWEWGASDGKILIYQINQNQGLTKIDAELPISVFPTIADRGQQITVELGEGNNATEINVVNELGQVVKRIPVENGQRTVTIPTNGFGSGLNILNTSTLQRNSSCKIIIK